MFRTSIVLIRRQLFDHLNIRRPINQARVLSLKPTIAYLSKMGNGGVSQMSVDTSARLTALRHLMRKAENEIHA